MRKCLSLLCGALAAFSISCGGSPSGPDGNGGPTTGPNPTTGGNPAAPTATPRPCVADGTCEAPTTSTTRPTRIEIRMYQVRKPNGDAAPCLNEDPVAPGTPLGDANVRYWFASVPIGYRVKLDATAFDASNKPTNGQCTDAGGNENRSCINWRLGHGEQLIDEYNTGHIFQPTFRVIGEGDFQIQAEMIYNGERIRSPWYWMNFTSNPSQSPCAR
jgi:hypothetical protein